MFFTLAIVSLIAIAGGGLSTGVQQVDEGIDAWESAVKSAIKDRPKRKAAIDFIEETRKELTTRRGQIGSAMKDYLEREADYNATPEELDSAISSLNDRWTAQEEWLVDQRFALQEMLTPEEWQDALSRVDKRIGGHWDVLKKAQKVAHDEYDRRMKKVK